MSTSAPQPSPRGQPVTQQVQGNVGRSGGTPGGGGVGTPGGGANWLLELAKALIAPAALAAVLLAIGGWFLTDKFDTISDQIKEIRDVTDHLDTRLTSADTANRDVNNLLNTKSIDLVQQIANTNVTVSAMKPQLDQISADMKGVLSSVNSLPVLAETIRDIGQRTTRVRKLSSTGTLGERASVRTRTFPTRRAAGGRKERH